MFRPAKALRSAIMIIVAVLALLELELRRIPEQFGDMT